MHICENLGQQLCEHSGVVKRAVDLRLQAFAQIPLLHELGQAAEEMRPHEADSAILLTLILCERAMDRVAAGVMEQVERVMDSLTTDPAGDLT